MTGSVGEEALTLEEGALRVVLWRDPDYVPGSAAGEVALSPHREDATRVEALMDGRAVASVVLLCEAGCPAITDGRALLRDGMLIACVRDHVVCLGLPSLDVRWMTDVDDACVFALMEIDGADALLVHGELDITRIGVDGRIQWRRGGGDIFTGGCWIDGDAVVAVDWVGAEYRWRLEDGEPLGVRPGAHPPSWETTPRIV